MTATTIPMTDLQREGAAYLGERPRAYLADPPGFGKTRQLLAAAGDTRLLVVCPAAIRDMKVWPREAERVGWGGELEVLSYHQLAQPQNHPYADRFSGVDTVVFDEAHNIKNRKVTWLPAARTWSDVADRVWLASGTPIPNIATELWSQLQVLRGADGIAAYWPWVQKWFIVSRNRYSSWVVEGDLLACDPRDPVCDRDNRGCKHWQDFFDVNGAGQMLRRARGLLDLPPVVGVEDPLDTPMTKEQARVYRGLKKDLLADFEGATLEALSATDRYVKLCLAATGVSCVDPATDPTDKQSGKLIAAREYLADRSTPTMVACYYRNTATVLQRAFERDGHRVGVIGGGTPGPERLRVADAFQSGLIDVLVGSVSVVSEGITLTAGDQVIMLERHPRPSTNEQTIDRLHRFGQTRPVSVRQLVTPDTVDSKRWDRIQAKESHISRYVTKAELERMI